MESYPEWVGLVAQLTVDSLNSWQWARDSVYYLLGLWSRYLCCFVLLCMLRRQAEVYVPLPSLCVD